MDKFLFPADFVILVMEEDDKVLIILGKPFLATGKSQINVQEGELKLRVQGDEVMFHVFQAMKHLNDETNDDIIEPSHKESMHGECKDTIVVVKKEKDIKKGAKEVNGVGENIFHPP